MLLVVDLDMFIVAHLYNDGGPAMGKIFACDTFGEAVVKGVALALENGADNAEKVGSYLSEFAEYFHDDGEWSVCIGQPE